MTTQTSDQRITATPAARRAIKRLRAARGGAVMFVQSGGCCAGSVPMCFPAGEFLTGPGDVLLGEIDGCPFYIAADLDQALRHPSLSLDVAPGQPEGFSLGPGPGEHFITHARSTAAATLVQDVMTTRVISVTESAGYHLEPGTLATAATFARDWFTSHIPAGRAGGQASSVTGTPLRSRTVAPAAARAFLDTR